MADYDFLTLSWPEFEELSRDLVAADTKLRFESFTAGSDAGIDFRANDAGGVTILQSKHYGRSGFARLLRDIEQKERPKLDKLKPQRYVLSTSVEMTPYRASALQSALSPYCKSTADIYGRERMNDLLEQHEDVHRRHFKLWITSTTVLQAVLNSGIWALSATELEMARLEASRFVEVPQFFEALDLLEDHHFCLIAGQPGIGKTTLAKMLSLKLATDEYEVITVSQDAEEAFRALNPNSKQLFYYDDFLGRSALAEKLNKNEDSRLKQLIERVRSSSRHRLILTTREYILHQAEAVYEPLKEVPFDLATCTITVGSLSRFTRAMILVNHLQFSDLPVRFIDEILENHAYLRIVDHANFNPRIVEAMTKDIGLLKDDDNYAQHFLLNLDNPERVWSHAYENQLTDYQRDLLITLASIPGNVTFEELRSATQAFVDQREGVEMPRVSATTFERALKDLEGSFIVTNRPRNLTDHVAEFQNPSIADYLSNRLTNSPSTLAAMVATAAWEEQVERLLEFLAARNERHLCVPLDVLVESAAVAEGQHVGYRLAGGPGPVAWRSPRGNGCVGYFNAIYSRVSRLAPGATGAWWTAMRMRVIDSLRHADADSIISLLRNLISDAGEKDLGADRDAIFAAVRGRYQPVLDGNVPDDVLVDVLDELRRIQEVSPDIVYAEETEAITELFRTDLEYADWTYESVTDADDLATLQSHFSAVGDWLDVPVWLVTQRIDEKLEGLSSPDDDEVKEVRLDSEKDDSINVIRDGNEYIASLFDGLIASREASAIGDGGQS